MTPDHVDPKPAYLFPLLIFFSGAGFGLFLTGIPQLTLENWQYWAWGRIIWQLGGALWFGSTLALFEKFSRIKGALLIGLVGLGLCGNPLLDMIQGPLALQGPVVGAKTLTGRVWHFKGASWDVVRGHIAIANEDGVVVQLETSGKRAAHWHDIFADCQEKEGTIQAVVLRNLEVVLTAACSE